MSRTYVISVGYLAIGLCFVTQAAFGYDESPRRVTVGDLHLDRRAVGDFSPDLIHNRFSPKHFPAEIPLYRVREADERSRYTEDKRRYQLLLPRDSLLDSIQPAAVASSPVRFDPRGHRTLSDRLLFYLHQRATFQVNSPRILDYHTQAPSE